MPVRPRPAADARPRKLGSLARFAAGTVLALGAMGCASTRPVDAFSRPIVPPTSEVPKDMNGASATEFQYRTNRGFFTVRIALDHRATHRFDRTEKPCMRLDIEHLAGPRAGITDTGWFGPNFFAGISNDPKYAALPNPDRAVENCLKVTLSSLFENPAYAQTNPDLYRAWQMLDSRTAR